ncbi:MAG: glycosyltransferase family 2 protein [Hyphomicrobiaceae bacterium]
MTFLDQITVLVLTFNEEDNIQQTLAALTRFSQVVVLDSGSTDSTAAKVEKFPNARLCVRAFDQHARQWNYGLEDCQIETPWVLALDADYQLSEALVDEIANLRPTEEVVGFSASFRYCVFGRPLKGSLYPPVIVLYRKAHARYIQQGHTQRLKIAGPTGTLTAKILHDDRKPLARWLSSQQNYARLEAAHLLSTPRGELRTVDRIRLRAWLAPFVVFFYTLIIKRCIFDGWPGWYYALQRMVAETFIALAILDRRLRGRGAARG